MIDEARLKIKALEREITGLKNKFDSIRKRCLELEIEVERLRTDIAVAETKSRNIDDEIGKLKARINVEEEKLAHGDLKSLESMVERLKALIPGIEREIDRQYYYCYGEGAVTAELTGSIVVYIIRGESFGNYLLTTYGSVKVPAVQRENIRFFRVNIFGNSWVSRFGYPFTD